MTTQKVLWIAEIGNNHNGDYDRALRLINFVKKIGCDVAKFQLRDFNTLYRNGHNSIEDLGVEYTKDLLAKYELPFESHIKLANYCESIGVEYMCTPWDIHSVNLLETLKVKRYKIASADFDNIPLIDRVIETGKEIILSTGMATTEDISKRCSYLKKMGASFTLLHCNSTYPAPLEDIELNYLKKIKQYSSNIGYSGHERGIAVSLGAIALGATIIERHITENKDLEGPDHQASLLPSEFDTLIRFGSELSTSLGRDVIQERKLSQGALLNKEVLGKSIVAKRTMKIGDVIKKNDLKIRSPGQGLPPTEVINFVGKVLTKKINKNDFISYLHVNGADSNLGQINLPYPNWGIPVRPHDVSKMHSVFDAPVYEFHISYKDLEREMPDESWDYMNKKKVLVHAPELFEESRLLDLSTQEDAKVHLKNINRVCEFSRKIIGKIQSEQTVLIITNIGGFSTHSFKAKNEIKELYERVAESLENIDDRGCEITIQNMAPFPWHFGGQRYQNIFADPDEIISFCKKYNRRITLDTAHLSMHCAYRKVDYLDAVRKLAPFTAHWHISDAQGTNGEGVQLGQGDINLSKTMEYVSSKQSYIVETWQGHKNDGQGFKRDLRYIESKINGNK